MERNNIFEDTLSETRNEDILNQELDRNDKLFLQDYIHIRGIDTPYPGMDTLRDEFKLQERITAHCLEQACKDMYPYDVLMYLWDNDLTEQIGLVPYIFEEEISEEQKTIQLYWSTIIVPAFKNLPPIICNKEVQLQIEVYEKLRVKFYKLFEVNQKMYLDHLSNNAHKVKDLFPLLHKVHVNKDVVKETLGIKERWES